jgi:predicted Zn-ribbon and HTH transcriptional regulator
MALRRGNGTFRKTTLQDFGIPKSDLATGPMTCADCGNTWNPIMKNGYCPKCDSQRKAEQKDYVVVFPRDVV